MEAGVPVRNKAWLKPGVQGRPEEHLKVQAVKLIRAVLLDISLE